MKKTTARSRATTSGKPSPRLGLKVAEFTAKFRAVLRRLRRDGAGAEPLLERLAKRSPQAFRTASFAWIRRGGKGEAAEVLLRVLHHHKLLLEMLINPGAMHHDDAIRIAKLAKQALPYIHHELAATIQRGTSAQAWRALRVLSELPLSIGVLPALASALNHQDPRVRALVAKLYGKLTADPDYLSALLKDDDPHVRSNTVEALSESPSEAAGELIHVALDDPHRRVAATAAIGLYRRGDPRGLEALSKLAVHDDPRTRFSAAWAIGQTADKSMIPLLERMSLEEVASVRGAAMAALRQMPKMRVDLRLRELGGMVRAHVSLLDPEGHAVRNLQKDDFLVYYSDIEVLDFELQGPADGERLVLAYLLPNSSGMGSDTIARMNAAVLKSLQYKGAEDICSVCKFSDTCETTAGFTKDLAQVDQALQCAGAGGGALRILDAVDETLETITMESGARGIVVLADGPDQDSRARLDQVVEKAQASSTPIHAIALGAEADHRTLRLLASQTQGVFVSVSESGHLEDACRRILDGFSSGYEIIFESEEGWTIQVEVRVRSDLGIGGAACTIKRKTAFHAGGGD